MRREDFLKLKVGDRVLLKRSTTEEWERAVVEEIIPFYPTDFGYSHTIHVRPLRRDSIGRRVAAVMILEDWCGIWLRPIEDQTTANVFADWLEEEGFLEAAEALRAKFPFVE
jgi:hypothetical protein